METERRTKKKEIEKLNKKTKKQIKVKMMFI